MPSVKELKKQILNIEKKLENNSLLRKKQRQLRRTLTRKRKQYNEVKPPPLQFAATMRVKEISSGEKSPLNYYTLTRGNKPRYKRSLTKTKKIYNTENPYPQYLANRAESGTGKRSQEYKKYIETILKQINSA